MYVFEQMEHPGYPFDLEQPVYGQPGIFDTADVNENTIYAFEADFSGGDIIFTDLKSARENKALINTVMENVHPEDAAAIRSAVSFISSYERRTFELTVRYIFEGDTRSFEVKGMAVSQDGRSFAIGYAYDLILKESLNKRLEYLETHDALTGLANAAAFDSFANDFFKFGMYPQTLIVAKIDRFHEINNSFGYIAGNTLIKNVAEVIKECFFDAEMIARIGGGEYCAVYAGKSQMEIDNKIKQTRMMLHGMYMNLVKTDVIFGYSSAEKAVSFCDLYRQALNKMRRISAVHTILTESTVIDSMNSIIETKAAWGKRAVRLQSLSAQVAVMLGCGEECVEVVKVLAKIADIGFIGLNDSLIKNRLSLTGDEYDAFMQHVDHGKKIIGKIDELKDLHELYKSIFKRYDEHPHSKIPLPSRIVAGVRGFDDIVSARGTGCRDITEKFMEMRGKQFCPEVVDAIADVACRHYALR